MKIVENFGGKQGLIIEDTFIPLNFYGEKLYLSISKPTLDEIDSLDAFELTSPVLSSLNVIRRNKQTTRFYNIEISERRKRLAMAPEDIVRKTFDCTTQFYMTGVGLEETIHVVTWFLVYQD